jgi:cytochrome c biogenesis protein ResB
VPGYTVSPTSGSVTVNGTNVNVPIKFTLVTYTITFTESGLTSGTSWNVTLNETLNSSKTTTITFTEPNGTYAYTVGSVPGYTVSPTSGSVTVNGTNVNVPIKFTLVTYTIMFTESGLTSGTSWSVTLNGALESSIASTITFTEPNGTYAYTVGSVPGYTVSPTSGSVTVKGANVKEPIIFTPIKVPPKPPNYLPIEIIIIVIVVIIVGLLAFYLLVWRKKKLNLKEF